MNGPWSQEGVLVLLIDMYRWFMDRATGIGREQQVDMKNPTTSVVAEKPLTEAQWVCISSSFSFLQ